MCVLIESYIFQKWITCVHCLIFDCLSYLRLRKLYNVKSARDQKYSMYFNYESFSVLKKWISKFKLLWTRILFWECESYRLEIFMTGKKYLSLNFAGGILNYNNVSRNNLMRFFWNTFCNLIFQCLMKVKKSWVYSCFKEKIAKNKPSKSSQPELRKMFCELKKIDNALKLVKNKNFPC